MLPLARIAAPLGVLASLLAPAAASAIDPSLSALKALQGGGASAARVPLGLQGGVHASAAARHEGLRALAATRGPARVLIAVRSHAAVDSVARDAAAYGTDIEILRPTAVVAVSARSASALARRFRADPRVSAVEPNRVRRISTDPGDDIDPETGIPFNWAFNEVRAAQGLAAVGGGSNRIVAVIDSGADVGHPDIAESIVATFNSNDGSADVTDGVGHGTFVTGLVSMQHDNGIGAKGAGGRTRVIAIRADDGFGRFSSESLLRAKEAAVGGGADIINLSLGGAAISESEARALVVAFLADLLPVAAAGNSGEQGNPVQFPAAALGGERGEVGIGLSVGATKPDGAPAGFSTHNRFVSVAAPGASQGACEKGVFSAVPANRNLIFDDPQSCSDVYSQGGGGRYGYSEGTSFAT
ncbi:MAG TPA: S8 family serine peptidase, partial [Thermoleophilaceae bacterium]|nr:S8 family serine peptidase [Thermoleophilaceae bacterium]